MFNPEQSIAEWRRQMLAAGIKSPVPLEELESHLREEFDRLTKSGLAAPDAFEAAVQQIGNAVLLKKEFKKANAISTWLERLMIGISLVFFALIVFLCGATVMMCFTSMVDRVVAVTSMICTVAVAYGWAYAVPFLPVFSSGFKRLAIGLGCLAGGFIASALYCDVILPRFADTQNGHPPASVFWAAFIIAVFSCAGIGLCLSEKDRQAMGMRNRKIKSHV
ncbi:MAG TPA: permease prefix domain 1-containing protein [Pseudomonadales bacterium]|nr:permease prefix domain 1-containing protein [Pseudomonadales bacterium]